MALSTSTGSLAVGASRTFNLSPGSALTLVAPPNCRVTVTETPNTVSASGVGGNASRVHNLQLGQTVTYGPYPMGGTVVVANASNSGGAVTWVRSDSIVAESASGAVSLVSGDEIFDAVRTKDFGDLVEPWCIAHRGAGAMLAPDSILSTYALGVTWGTGIIDGGDWYAVTDGGVFDFHDSTLTAKTNQTGNTTDATSMQMQRLTIDASSWFGGGVADAVGCLTPEQFFSSLRGNTCFAPEPKNLVAATYLATYLSRAGLQRACLANAFDDSFLTPFLNAGFPYVLRNLNTAGEHAPGSFTPARAAALYAMGVRYIGVNIADSDAPTAIATAKAAGHKVMAGIMLRQKDKATWDALGVNGYASDDPVYFMGRTSVYRKTTAPFAANTFYHGHIDRHSTYAPGSNSRGSFANSRLIFNPSDANYNWILQGWGSPIANASSSYTLTVSIKLTTLIADKTRWPGIAICCPDDGAYSDNTAASTGYQIWINPSTSAGGGAAGQINIIEKNAGAGVGVATTGALSVELTAGVTLTLAIAVTPSSITVTASGAATGSVVLNDSTYRGGYFHFGHATSASGAVFEFGPVTIT